MHNELSSSFLCLFVCLFGFGVCVCVVGFFSISLGDVWFVTVDVDAWLIVSISDQQTVLWYRFGVYFYCIIHSFRKDSTIDGHILKSSFASTIVTTAAAKHTLFRSINLMMCKIPTKQASKQQTNNHSALLFDRNQCRRKHQNLVISKLVVYGFIWFWYDLHASPANNTRWNRVYVLRTFRRLPMESHDWNIHESSERKERKRFSAGANHLLPHYYDQISFWLSDLCRLNRRKWICRQ